MDLELTPTGKPGELLPNVASGPRSVSWWLRGSPDMCAPHTARRTLGAATAAGFAALAGGRTCPVAPIVATSLR